MNFITFPDEFVKSPKSLKLGGSNNCRNDESSVPHKRVVAFFKMKSTKRCKSPTMQRKSKYQSLTPRK